MALPNLSGLRWDLDEGGGEKPFQIFLRPLLILPIQGCILVKVEMSVDPPEMIPTASFPSGLRAPPDLTGLGWGPKGGYVCEFSWDSPVVAPDPPLVRRGSTLGSNP